MPFKALHTPRRVTDVDGEVRAAAVLATPGLVAMVSRDPVRLAIHPVSGSGGRKIDLGLSSGDDVAFITKDTLVVRSGDEVWALLGVSHAPRPEQVARDARALCMRPTGESALVLGWDGSATALTMGKDEVVARPFVLRGDVRAADLGATETVVVVADGAGGELRVHPGATPESGARERARLPREAASFDEVRGGRDLCAVFKAGASEVCVVRREGSGLVAKMIGVGAKVADVQVLETTMFVALEDGRVTLFDRETLASSSHETTPSHALALGAKGHLTALGLTGKSAPVLWIGSSSGEIFQLGVTRKTTA